MKARTLPVPKLRCGFCRSTSIEHDPEERGKARCAACGRLTGLKAARRARQQEIMAVVFEGLGDDA